LTKTRILALIFAIIVWGGGAGAGVALSYMPIVDGVVEGNILVSGLGGGGTVSGYTATVYEFSFSTAAGWWFLFLVLGFIVLQLGIIIANQQEKNAVSEQQEQETNN